MSKTVRKFVHKRTSSGSLIDFLSYRPEDLESEEEVSEEAASEEAASEEAASEEASDNNSGNGEDDSSGSGSGKTNGRNSRKQNRPKRRVNRVMKEIKKLQNSTKLLIPRLPFQRVIREVLQQRSMEMRIQGLAIECLRESAEYYLVQLFEDANLACFHRQRVTVDRKDMRFVRVIRGFKDPGRP